MPAWLPSWVTPQLMMSMLVIFVVVNSIADGALYLILLDRRGAAWIQDRCGPNRVGPMGLLQPIADTIKLLFKEEYIPRRADRVLFLLAPGLTVIPALISFAVIPWAGTLQIAGESVAVAGATVNIGIIYLVAVTSLGIYGVVLGGWASNNKYAFLGSLRAAAQMVSYEIPMGLSILVLILTAATVHPAEMVARQLEGQWFLLHQPLAAIIFFTCMLAEANRLPFDLAESESELVGGWHTEYSSLKWAFFFMGEYGHILVGSAFFTVMFLGGWSINPFTGADLPTSGGLVMILLQVGVVMGKVLALIGLIMALRWTLPRFRYDQVMRLAWEGMIPASLFMLLVTSVYVYLGLCADGLMWTGSLGVIFLIWLGRPLVARKVAPNKRIPIPGSRFSPL